MTITTIWAVRNAIKAKLDTLTWDGKVFVEDANYFTTKATWFPFIMFEPSNLSSVFADTANNYRSYTFNVVIVQEMTIATRKDALDILINCFQKLCDALDQDWTLWGVVQQVDATSGEFGEIDMERWPALYLSSNVVARVLVPITN